MNDFIATGLPIIVFSCTLLQHIFSMLLRRIIPEKMPIYNEIFTFTNPALTQGEAMPSIRLKYLLPWITSPDLSAFSSSATYFLFLSRLFAILGTVTLIGTVLFAFVLLRI